MDEDEQYPASYEPSATPFDASNVPFNVSHNYDIEDVIGEGAYGVVV